MKRETLPDFRALCAELVEAADELTTTASHDGSGARLDAVVDRARAALAVEAEVVGPSDTRAQRLVDEFEDAAYLSGGSYITRHGIAAVLRHLVATESDPESWGAVPANRMEALADALTAPTLLERAMAGDATAARQFLHQAGFTDMHGQWLPQYQPITDDTDA